MPKMDNLPQQLYIPAELLGLSDIEVIDVKVKSVFLSFKFCKSVDSNFPCGSFN